MSWFLIATTGISDEELNDKLKKILRTSPFFLKMFKEYGISMCELKNLQFHIKSMKGRHAQSKGKDIFLSKNLFGDGNFFDNKIHFVVHELVHWLTKMREKNCYISDPEEVEAFTFGMLYELLRGKKEEEIKNIFFPILSAHLDTEENAEDIFRAFFTKAKDKLKKYL